MELAHVTQRFGARTVIDNVSLQVEEGEILALLGPNGSGKSTLLRVLAFLLKPQSGEIRFQGELLTDKNSERMRLQSVLVFQKTLLFNTSVFNNVAYGLKIRNVPKPLIDQEVQEALKLVKLEGFDKRPAKKLSGGEQQRVALARALVLKSKLLLLDEPTANLDPKNAAIIEDVIATINRELGTTIVLATHNMFQAQSLPNHIAVIREGKIIEVGETADIFGALSKNLASFAVLGNTFKGKSLSSDSGTSIVDIGDGVKIETAVQIEGDVSIFIHPDEIILSKNLMVSSARNILKGKITAVSIYGPLVKLTVDVGKPFIVQITKRSFNEMGLNLDMDVFITFKASSVQVI